MSERAYSFELKNIISAKKAVELSKSNQLEDARAFCCCDDKCRIKLTCSNWKNTSGKRFYFVPTHNDELHVIGCDEIGKKEERQQIGKEIKDTIEKVMSNGIITMMVSPDKNTKVVGDVQNTESMSQKEKGYLYKKENEYKGIRREGKRAARIETYIELFNTETINKDNRVICVKGEMYSLNELFISSENMPDEDVFGIFYGKAVINTYVFKQNMIEITYLNSSLPKIYTNVNCMRKISNGNEVKKYIDTNKSVITYFRGIYKQGENKFEPFNDKYYKDLSFEFDNEDVTQEG